MLISNTSRKHLLAPNYDNSCNQSVPSDIRLSLESLILWQSGDTNRFVHQINGANYDRQLRVAITQALKNGQDSKVSEWINRDIDLWIIMEAGNLRNYEWPDHQIDGEVCAFLLRVYEHRQKAPSPTAGDADCDALIGRILKKATMNGYAGKCPVIVCNPSLVFTC